MFLSKDKLNKDKFKFYIYNYPNNYKFVSLKYKKLDLIFQTPKLYCAYGITKYKYVDLSLINKENSSNLRSFINQLDIIYEVVKHKFKKFKIKNYKTDDILKCKVNNNISIFDNYKNRIYKIHPNTYGNFIINLNGLWIDDKLNLYFNWIVVQAKIMLPLYLDEYLFIEESKTNINDYKNLKNSHLNSHNINYRINKDKVVFSTIPPPPPPPPLSFFSSNKKSLKDIINTNKSTIKKVKINNFVAPTMQDIKQALSNLNKISNL